MGGRAWFNSLPPPPPPDGERFPRTCNRIFVASRWRPLTSESLRIHMHAHTSRTNGTRSNEMTPNTVWRRLIPLYRTTIIRISIRSTRDFTASITRRPITTPARLRADYGVTATLKSPYARQWAFARNRKTTGIGPRTIRSHTLLRPRLLSDPRTVNCLRFVPEFSIDLFRLFPLFDYRRYPRIVPFRFVLLYF